jgi:hypothetical protein
MADAPSVAAPAAPLPSSDRIAEAESFTREVFLHAGEEAAVALAPGTARRRALDLALRELEQGLPIPSTKWRRRYSLLLGLERVLLEDEPRLADGTSLNPHQVDALSGTLTALLTLQQGNGSAVAPPIGAPVLAVDEEPEEDDDGPPVAPPEAEADADPDEDDDLDDEDDDLDEDDDDLIALAPPDEDEDDEDEDDEPSADALDAVDAWRRTTRPRPTRTCRTRTTSTRTSTSSRATIRTRASASGSSTRRAPARRWPPWASWTPTARAASSSSPTAATSSTSSSASCATAATATARASRCWARSTTTA